MASDELMRAWKQGANAWPQLVLEFAEFEAQANHAPDLPHAADYFLAVACLARAANAARALEARHRSDIEAVARRLGLSELVDEIEQRVLHVLLVGGKQGPALAGYEGRGPLRSWLKVVAVRQAYNVARERQRRGRREVAGTDNELLDQAMVVRDPELAHLQQLYRSHVQIAFEHAFKALTSEDRQWLRFAYVEGLNLDRLAALFHTSRATAGRRRRKALDRLLLDTRRRVADALDISDGDVESVMNLVRSRLHLSLSRLLESSC